MSHHFTSLTLNGWKICEHCWRFAKPGDRFCGDHAADIRRAIRALYLALESVRTIYRDGTDQIGRPAQPPRSPLDVPPVDI